MTSDQLGGIVRAILSCVGGYLVGKGLIDSETVLTVTGAIATLATAIWSWHTNKPEKLA